ncbi:MBG domain-containing protein [Methylobacter sp.]|uniref:MBG domain-containing protein n=3 Tax=Methylobacter sp. TaxID=2051955 RepID=UPI002FE03B32
MKPNRKKQPARHPSLFDSSLPLRRVLNLAILAALYPSFSYANPDGAQIVSGQVSIDTATPGVTTVTNSPNAIINWQNFSIAQNELTQFIQQNGQSAVLNRIIGQNPSEILGQLASNGKVFLINPNGIVFGAGSTIDTQGLIASSLNLSDQDFQNGNYHFMAGSSAGNILNEGIIRAGKDGNIVLIAPHIENNGIIKSEGGSITLAAGQELTITSLDSPDIRFQIQAPADSVLNLGKLLTEGGAINVFAGTIKHSGEINADSVEVDAQGNIRLVAQQDITLASGSKISANNSQVDAGTIHIESKTGTTLAQGAIEAQATQAGKGGKIELLGERVGVLDQAKIDASGQNGGGQVLVGGDYHGDNPSTKNAKRTVFSNGADIKADAVKNGDGGKVVVWADEQTKAYGAISAKGGAQSGNGGFVETSGRQALDFHAKVNVNAYKGKGGTLLLDPATITLVGGSGDGATDGYSTFQGSSTDGTVLFSDTGISNIYQSELEGLASGTNIVLEAADYINATGSFSNLVTLASNVNLTMRTRNSSTDGSELKGINLVGSTDSSNLEFKTQGTGSISLQTGTGTSPQFATIDVGKLTTAGGQVSVNASGNVVLRAVTTTPGSGNGGNIDITSGGYMSLGGGNIDARGNTAAAGNVTLNSGGAINIQTNKTIYADQLKMIAVGGITDGQGTPGPVRTHINALNALNSGSGSIKITNDGTNFSISDIGSTGYGVKNMATGQGIYLTNVSSRTIGVNKSITSSGGAVEITGPAGVSFVASEPVSSNGGNIAISATGASAQINMPASSQISSAGGNIQLTADGMSFTGSSINAGSGSVTLLPGNIGTIIELGQGATDASGVINARILGLTEAELRTITTSNLLTVGGSSLTGNMGVMGQLDLTSGSGLTGTLLLNAGNANITISESLSAPATLALTTNGGTISQHENKTISATALKAMGGIVTLDQAANPVGVIAGSATSGNFKYRSSNLVSVSTVDGQNGLSVNDGNILLQSDHASGINQSSPISTTGALALKAIGPVNLPNSGNNISQLAADLNPGSSGSGSFFVYSASNMNVGGPFFGISGIRTNNQDIEINTGTGSTLTISNPIAAGTANVDLRADTLALTSTVTASDVGLTPYTSGRAITLGSATCQSSPCLTLTDLYRISASAIGIGTDNAARAPGAIYVAGITSGNSSVTDFNASSTRIGLLSGAGITQGGTINVRDLGIKAAGTVNLPLANTVTNLAAKTNGQNFTFNNGQDFSIAQLSGGIAPHDYNISGINTCPTSGTCGDVTLTSTGTITPSTSLNANIFTLGSGTWSQVNASLPTFSATDFRISGGTFIRALGGDGSSDSPYQLSDVYGLQGIGSTGMLNNYYTLSNNILAGGTSAWNSAEGFLPISVFTGTFNGQGHTISGLNINRPSTSNIGLFGNTGSGSTVKNVGLTGASITGYSDVGGLVGSNDGNIKKSYVTGVVTGNNLEIGGLVGLNNGGIDASYVSAMTVYGQTASTSNDDDIGGLVGLNNGTIIYSSSAGTVIGVGDVGGLVGHNSGTLLDQSYSTMTVTSDFSVYNDGTGGLVGWNSGPITNSYATGAVSAGNYSQGVGGLVGTNYSSITNSYSTGSVTSGIHSQYVGGLVGLNNGTVTESFWDTQSSSQPTIGIGSDTTSGATGLTTTNMETLSNFVNWNFSTIWRMYEGYTAPLLKSLLKPISITASSANKTYDGLAYSGGNGVTYSIAEATLLGIFSYSGSAQGAINAGSYSITPSGLYSSQQGYDISYTSGSLTINPAVLSITANSLSKTYGDIDPVLTYNASGFVNGESSSVLTGALTRAAGETVAGGPYAIHQGSLSGSNYNINYTGATFTINPAVLSITANNLSKTYGDVNPTLTASVTGLKYDDTSLIITGLSTTADRSSGVGSYVINASAASAGTNYTITSATNGNLTINPAVLSITANSLSKTYGDIDPVLTYNASGFVNGESSSVLTGALTRAAGETVAGGPYAIHQGSLSGSNYNINYTGAMFTITPAQLLSVKADNAIRVYGDANPVFTGSFISGGLVKGDTLSSIGLTYSTLANPFANVGIYAITPKITSSNYTFVGIDGQLSVTPRPLDVTAIAANKTYGEPDPMFTYTATGFVNGEPASVLTGILARTAGETVAEGPYTINQGSLSANSNYSISYSGSILTINPALLTITADNLSKTYGDSDPVFTYIATGFVNGESSSVLTGALTRDAGETVAGGPYDIHQGSLANSNYSISYIDADFTINLPPTEKVSGTVTESIEKVTAVVVGTTTQQGQPSSLGSESNNSNESTGNSGSTVSTNGSSDSKTGKGKNAKECTK